MGSETKVATEELARVCEAAAESDGLPDLDLAASRLRQLEAENNKLRDPHDPEGWKAQANEQALWQLSSENAELRADRERLEWWLSNNSREVNINEFLGGVREGWTINQWRSWIDKQREENTDG